MQPRYLDAIKQLGTDPGAIEDVFAGVDFGVFVDHVEHGCIYANRESLRMFQLNWEQFKGFGWAGVVLPADLETLREAIERYEREKTTIVVQYRIRVPDGSIRTISVVGRAVLDANGDQRGSVMIGREVTADRADADRMVHAQKLEIIGGLAGRIAHDINNVLTPIMCSAALLETEPLSEEGKQFLETIMQGVDHAASITRQLLGYSHQQVDLHRVCVPDEEMGHLETMLAQLLGETITLQLKLQARGLQVGLARHELGQVILNLAVNGRDAMAGSGVLGIETRSLGERIEIVVTDGGCGMSAQVQKKMFDAFFTTKSADRGTGLGLSTVNDLVRRAGGQFRVESAPDKGTQIAISLPCLGTNAPDSIVPELPEVELATLNVLIVEDNSALRQTLAYVLALRRHRVKTSANLAGAFKLLETEAFDVVVTDVLLPDGEGPELVAAARAENAGLRVIYMSGFAGAAHHALDTNAPGTLFLQKPFPPNQLVSALGLAMTGASGDAADRAADGYASQ